MERARPQWPLMTGPMAWTGEQLHDEAMYTYHLSKNEVEELEQALRDFKDLELDGPDIRPSNFKLPTLGPKLLAGTSDLHNGKGFLVVRGLNPSDYSPEDNVMLFLGISSYIGEDRAKQDNLGNMLAHLCHDRRRYPKGQGPAKHSNKPSPFHTDFFCDILALHVRGIAAEGGSVKLASSWTIYNRLLATRPDLVQVLSQPVWQFDGRGKLFPEVTRPLLFVDRHKVILDFSRRPLTGTQTNPEGLMSRLSPIQKEALLALEDIASENELVLDSVPGDMVFVNNHALLHSRNEFRDDAHHARHLVRMWLRNPRLAWALPPVLARGNSRIYYENLLRERWAVAVTSSLAFTVADTQCVDTDLSH